MKRSINRWTTTLATAAVLGLPVISTAHPAQEPAPQQQQPPAPQPQPAQPRPEQPTPEPAQPQPAQPQPAQPQPTQPQPAQPQPADPKPSQPMSAATSQAGDQAVSPQDHLRQAQAALNSITPASVPAKNRAQLAEMKRHLSALERAGSSTAATGKATPPARSGSASANANWGTEVAAVDKIITEMVGNDTATGTSGTTGAPSAQGTTGTRSKAAAAVALDEATRAKLMDVRTHITAYAAGMSGAATTPKTDAAAPAPEQAGMTAAAGQQSQSPAATAPAQSATPQPAQSATAQPTQTATQQPATTPTDPAAGAATPAGQAQVDAEAARRALTTARETLNQLTQLPASAQLSGETRTQVTQLISNFNELITTQSNWHASYDKVAANLAALLGPDNMDAAVAAPAPATATAGAVGTAGTTTTQLDPALRAKLIELRRTLSEFQKASGGADSK